MAFEDMTVLIKSKSGKLTVTFMDSQTGKQTECFKIDMPEDYFTEDHDNYIFISAYSGRQLSNEHLIHKIRFRDINHLHDEEEIDSAADREFFMGKANDVIRQHAVSFDE